MYTQPLAGIAHLYANQSHSYHTTRLHGVHARYIDTLPIPQIPHTPYKGGKVLEADTINKEDLAKFLKKK